MRQNNASVKFIPVAILIILLVGLFQKCSSQSPLISSANAQKITPKKYTGKIVGGSVLFVTGVRVLGLTIFADNYTPATETFPTIKKPGLALGFSFGGASAVTGAILMGIGLNERNIYRGGESSLSLICSDRIGIAYNF